jgi:hypothetical protein
MTRETVISPNAGTFLVIFGFRRAFDGEFVVSHARPSRSYKSEKAANKAAADWING